jgi:hypothetical protein
MIELVSIPETRPLMLEVLLLTELVIGASRGSRRTGDRAAGSGSG